MARIDSRLLFLTTSPRTPEKMVPEIDVLARHFTGSVWDHDTQCAYMDRLRREQCFEGKGEKDPAFSARDRINRAPKALGLVTLSPTIALTQAGERLLTATRKDEVLLRQMLKFQIPSPYHKPTGRAATFCVKPYLELLRLVRTLGTLRFDELQIFGMQLTDWHIFGQIVGKIEAFRAEKATCKGNYQKFKTEYLNGELRNIYADRIRRGDTKTRESADTSLEKFLRTQTSNMRDYADACFQYLRVTGLVAVSHVGKSLSIVPERTADVDYILQTVDRDPVATTDEAQYAAYLGNADLPRLATDERGNLIQRLRADFPEETFAETESTTQLKDRLSVLMERSKANHIAAEIGAIKAARRYDDIQATFDGIIDKTLYDSPLMMEWNVWRAMTMMDGGDIRANLRFDDYGKPMSTATGNLPDIVCDYGDFDVCVEVTLAGGQRQYETEGEPVTRHLGRQRERSGKPCYCLFIAKDINEACIAHFYTLHHLNLKMYGGKSVIIPLPLAIFRKMLEDARKAAYTPRPAQVLALFRESERLAASSDNEADWYARITQRAPHWLE